jgi:NAD(P)-dependent dehydrogenase (short-subunit alcohol dehydrogenase family)
VKGAANVDDRSKDLEGQRPLVSGAPSGIGRAVAVQLARDGDEVVVHGLPEDRGRLHPGGREAG